MKKLLLFLCATLMFFSTAREASCDYFYMTGIKDQSSSYLVKINSETAETTVRIPIPGRIITDLAFTPDGNTLYGYDTLDAYDGFDKIVTIDTSTGTTTFVANVIGWSGIGVGIAFAQDGTLYASNGGDLVTINTSDGAASFVIQGLANEYDVDGLDFSSDGTLFGINGAGPLYALFTFDLDNNQIATTVYYTVSTDIPNIQSLAFDPTGVLFGINNGDGNWGAVADEYLVTINPNSGETTDIGPIRPGFYGGLVYGGPDPFPEPVNIDIKPNSCPNALNINPKGIITVAILGTADLNVTNIDPLSVKLKGVDQIRSSVKDVTTPVSNPLYACECNSEWEDGFDDLILKFKASDVLDVLGEVQHGDEVALPLTGNLYDGTPIEGYDCIVFVSKGN
jgi:hypothetical protein